MGSNPKRIAANIVTGIAFPGAGAIMRTARRSPGWRAPCHSPREARG